EVKLRNDISELLKERRMYRRIRRNRLRYRKPRFDNRISSNENKKYSVQGVQNKGEYIKLTEMSKPVKTDLVKPYMFRKGFSMFYNCNSSPTYRSGSLLAGK
ncbi:MAG: RRXRR domain-containing protein, partial [Defluviitoga tunisiensis]